MMRQYELVERVQKYDPDADEDLLNRAYVYAMKAHGNQVRASGEAYFNHPLEVAAILTEMKLDSATIAAALLHDTVEDTEATHQEIEEKFGPEIASLVDGLTKIAKLDLVTKEAAQAENLRKLLLAMSKDVRVLLVKLADRLHNMRTLHFVKPDKRVRIAQETMDIYAPLAGRMGMQAVRDELEDIAFRVLNPDANKIILDRLAKLHTESGGILKSIEAELTQKLAENGIKAEVHGRRSVPIRFSARWSGSCCRWGNCRTSSASASSSAPSTSATGRWASFTAPIAPFRDASRTTSRRRSRTTTARSIRPSSDPTTCGWRCRSARG